MDDKELSDLLEYLEIILNASKFMVRKKKFKKDIINIKKMIKYIHHDKAYKILKNMGDYE